MSCTRTVWLIDTENIPKKWVKTVYFKTKRDKLIIFLGPEATCMSLKELQVFLTKYPANQVEFCNSNAGKNSMDFHIAAKLGSLCTTGKKSHYIIVSGDKGYDGLIQTMCENGFCVSRMTCDAAPAQKESPETVKSISAITDSKSKEVFAHDFENCVFSKKLTLKTQTRLSMLQRKFLLLTKRISSRMSILRFLMPVPEMHKTQRMLQH